MDCGTTGLLCLNANNTRHIVYGPVKVRTVLRDDGVVEYTIATSMDVCSDIDLVLSNPGRLSVNNMIRRVELLIGGQPAVTFDSQDLQTHLYTTCALLVPERKIATVNGKTFVPLCIAELPLLAIFGLEVKLYVTYCDGFSYDTAQLYANHHYLQDEDRRKLASQSYVKYKGVQSYAMTYDLNQHSELRLVNFLNVSRVGVIFFWGDFDKHKIQRLRFSYKKPDNDKIEYDLYDGPIEPWLYKTPTDLLAPGMVVLRFASEKPWESTLSVRPLDFVLEFHKSYTPPENAKLHMVVLSEVL